MDNLKVGDIINISITDGLLIVVTHVKDEKFQGVYYNSLTHEFNTTPMLPKEIAIKVEQENR